MRLLKTVVAVSFLFFAANATAATWYVSTAGNDANAGSLSSPFRTINKAAGVARPGDEVLVRGGVYSGLVTIGSKGTASARIAFRSYPGEKAVIDGTGTETGKDLVTLYRAEYVDFSGFEVRNARKIGVTGYASNNIRFSGNEVHRSVRNGIYFGYSSSGSSYDIVIDGNYVHDNVLENQYQALSGGGWANAIIVSRTDRAQITNNRVSNNYGEGIDVLLSSNVVVRGNTVSDNFSVGIYLDNARYTTVDRNLVFSTGDTRYYRGGYPAAGIQMANESYSVPNPLTDITVSNNIVVQTKWGFYYGNYEAGGGLKNTRIANNTFYDSVVSVIDINNDAHQNSVVENNIFFKGPSAKVAGSGVTYRNNNWYATNAGSAAGAGDVYGNPALVRPGGYAAADYKLTSSSAARAAGADVYSYVKSDHFGSPRSRPLDIGAHQFSTGTSSSVDTQAPTAPANLRVNSVDETSVSLGWSASTDNVGVTGYRVYRDGIHVATVAGTTFTNTGLNSGNTYTYTVTAVDAAGNQSAASNQVSATTLKTKGGGSKRRAA